MSFNLSTYYSELIGSTNFWQVPVRIQRATKAPLDCSTLFKTYADALTYAQGGTLSVAGQDKDGKQDYVQSNAYPGQYVAVVPEDGSPVSAFVIDKDGLVPLATGGDLEATLTQIRNDLNVLSGETVSDINALSDAISAEVSARIADISALSGEIKDIKEVSLGELSSYEVTVTEAETAEAGYLKTYVIKQGNKLDAKINIPKDFLVKSAEIKTAETDLNDDIQAGEKYIDFVINSLSGDDNESHVYLALNDLVDVYTGISSDTVTVSIDEDRKVQAVVNDGSIGWAKLDAEVNSWKASVDLSVENLSAYANTLNENVGLSVTTLEGQIAKAASDASDAAAKALTDAKAYTDEVSAGLGVDTKITEAKKYAEDAAISVLGDAKAYVDALSTATDEKINAVDAKVEALSNEVSSISASLEGQIAQAASDATAAVEALSNSISGTVDAKVEELNTAIEKALSDANAYTDEQIAAIDVTDQLSTLSAETLTDAKAYTDQKVEALSTSLSNEVTATYATKTELANKGQELSDYVDSKVADLNIGDYATKAEVNTISTDHEGRIATLESGTSALSGRMDKVESDITSISNDYATKEYVNTQDAATLSTANKYTDDKIATLGNPLRFVGVVNAVTDVENPQDGDVVLVGTKEFVYNNGKWTEFGDESTHATVTALEAEKQAREAADAYISAAVDNKIFAGDYGNIVSADSLSVIKITQDDYHALVKAGDVDDKAVYIVNNDGAYNMYDERIINVGAPISANDAATKEYVDAAKEAAIAAIPLSVSQLIWDIEEIHCGGAN